MGRGVRGALGTVALCVAGIAAGPVTADQADPASCAVEGSTLIVKAHGDDVTITREDERVAVIGPGGVVCKGGTRRLDRLDAIRVSGADLSTVDLRNGPLSPGATPEPDGTDEIEVRIAHTAYPEILASDDSQRIEIGVDPSGGATVDFDPVAGAPEADIGYAPNPELELELHTGPGDDVLDARHSHVYLVLFARAGDDRILGPETGIGEDALSYLSAGPGNDYVDGGPDTDVIDGGRGDDDCGRIAASTSSRRAAAMTAPTADRGATSTSWRVRSGTTSPAASAFTYRTSSGPPFRPR